MLTHESRQLPSWLIFDVRQNMRSEVHTAFVKRFAFPPLKVPPPVSTDDIHAVEEELQTTFPAAFVSFLVAHGPIFTPDILGVIVDAQEAGARTEAFDVREFFSPAEMTKTYRMYVGGGMDESLIPFAMDSGGSVFGFRRSKSLVRPDDCPVLFFDHDYCRVRAEADSFDQWLSRFVDLKVP